MDHPNNFYLLQKRMILILKQINKFGKLNKMSDMEQQLINFQFDKNYKSDDFYLF